MTSKRYVILVALAIAATTSAFVTHLALRFQNVAIGYSVQTARDEGAAMRERANQLRVQIAARRAPQALTDMARAQLGMVEADRVTTVVAGAGARAPRVSGRAR